MKKPKFKETQIVKAIKEHESGRKVENICRSMEALKAKNKNPLRTITFQGIQ